MIYVDTNVVMYAVGRPHPLRDEARDFLSQSLPGQLITSAEMLQELLHAYLPVGRTLELDAAMRLASSLMIVVDVTAEDARAARGLAETTPSLTARDLIHLAICLRENVEEIRTYDRALAAAFKSPGR